MTMGFFCLIKFNNHGIPMYITMFFGIKFNNHGISSMYIRLICLIIDIKLLRYELGPTAFVPQHPKAVSISPSTQLRQIPNAATVVLDDDEVQVGN